MPVASLTRLVGDPGRFLRDSFGRAPLHVPARGDVFDDVLSLDHVDRIVAASGLRAPSFRLVKDGATLPTSRVTRRVRIGSRPVDDLIDVAAVHALFDDGASIVLQGLHRSWAPVAELCRELEAELTHPVQANAYLTPPVAQGLHLHEDPHDVFAIQTHGVKRWVVHPPGGPAWDLELRAGDVLYLPAGTRHAAQTIEQPSLHLTIGVRTVSMAQVLRRALETSLDEPDLRAPLPAGWADDLPAIATDVAKRLDELAMRLRDGAQQAAETAARTAAAEFWSHRTPDRRGGLIDLLELDQLADSTVLRVRPALSLSLERDDDGMVSLVLADRTLRFPGPLAAVLEEVIARSRFAPRELDEVIDAPSRRVLCRRLIREGVLTFDRDDEGRRA